MADNEFSLGSLCKKDHHIISVPAKTPGKVNAFTINIVTRERRELTTTAKCPEEVKMFCNIAKQLKI